MNIIPVYLSLTVVSFRIDEQADIFISSKALLCKEGKKSNLFEDFHTSCFVLFFLKQGVAGDEIVTIILDGNCNLNLTEGFSF